MGWGTEFNTDIFISKQNFSSNNEVEEKLIEYDKIINNFEAIIKMYVSSTPKDIIPIEFDEEPMNWLNIQINELFENYRETLIERYKLLLYQEYIVENNIDLLKNNQI